MRYNLHICMGIFLYQQINIAQHSLMKGDKHFLEEKREQQDVIYSVWYFALYLQYYNKFT